MYIWYHDLRKHELIIVGSNPRVFYSIVQRFVYTRLGAENIHDINSTWSHNALIMAIIIIVSGYTSWLVQ